ncbi:hypothetical protein BDBG_06786 [Blastomyces gilchristii SLH14081]|uniref:Fungal-type protein kinase domain-containing protein n=1 Tax=Blastomyces gilchristii (strain SLH14081) TaxID=559298 RepID=A0A179UVF7_BLAGS|nr:uncharacterized protein BDBG_06786 [Blastomyces gilchristii SLH14081]OAT11031.1 hypothetical protein BDBG_06786 [Blastomyces gilchristii SLH14081]
MAELSPDEIATVEIYPLRNSLDRVRGFLQGAAEQSHGGAADGPDQTYQKAISKALIALMDAKAAYNLRPPISSHDHYRPIVQLIIQKAPDTDIWKAVYNLITTVTHAEKSTPPPRQSLPILQTPRSRNTSSLANSSELQGDIDRVLREELLEDLHADVPGFYAAYFDDIEGLVSTAQAMFENYKTSDSPLYRENGWKDWPDHADEKTPAQPVAGSTAKRKLDIGFVDDPHAMLDKRYEWSQILYDIPSEARLDLARFTLCGPLLCVWEFDCCGGIGSAETDINQDGLQFITVILGFLFMNRRQLGFDPTVVTVDGQRCIEIERDGKKEHLVIDGVILRAHCVVGRATTCWKAHRQGDERILVVKDSWQYLERDEEGELLREAMESGVTNVARYYFHETVQVDGKDDDVRTIRKGLEAPKPKQGSLQVALRRSASNRGHASQSSGIGRKRSSDCVDTVFPPPPSKRTQSTSPMKRPAGSPPNRVHRRVIVQDYGKPIYESSSRVALLVGMEGCIVGYESLYSRARLIQSDISPRNLLINENEDNPSWRSFLIDLDLAIRTKRDGFLGARGKTGTRAFMAIGVLIGEEHSFMHDLESFFWVLFWICIHYEAPGKGRKVKDFEKWNYMSTRELGGAKIGAIADEEVFLTIMDDYFTPYYQPLSCWVNRLRRIVFPNNGRWKRTNSKLGSEMRKILQDAQRDLKVIG